MANITLLGASYTDVPAVTLPQTGGGTVTFYENSGGAAPLPSIISKIDGGSFTPTSDQNTSSYSISHNLGIAPTGAVIWATNITYESYASRAVDMLQMTDARWSIRQVNTNGAARMTYGNTTSGDLGASSFKFTLASNVYKSGVTYRWLVWA